jgi:hypothetical protein
MARSESAEATSEARKALCKDFYGEEYEVSESGIAKTKFGHTYISDPNQPLSKRNKTIADMLAVGYKKIDIARQLGLSSQLITIVSRDPRVMQRIEDSQLSMAEQAKNLLNESVLTAATNVVNAVEGGDLKESHFVLSHAGIVEQKSQPNAGANINLNFGDWLSSGSNTKEIHSESISETRKQPKIITDASDLEDDQSDGGCRL